jgi:hypothetical protein
MSSLTQKNQKPLQMRTNRQPQQPSKRADSEQAQQKRRTDTFNLKTLRNCMDAKTTLKDGSVLADTSGTLKINS